MIQRSVLKLTFVFQKISKGVLKPLEVVKICFQCPLPELNEYDMCSG